MLPTTFEGLQQTYIDAATASPANALQEAHNEIEGLTPPNPEKQAQLEAIVRGLACLQIATTMHVFAMTEASKFADENENKHSLKEQPYQNLVHVSSHLYAVSQLPELPEALKITAKAVHDIFEVFIFHASGRTVGDPEQIAQQHARVKESIAFDNPTYAPFEWMHRVIDQNPIR